MNPDQPFCFCFCVWDANMATISITFFTFAVCTCVSISADLSCSCCSDRRLPSENTFIGMHMQLVENAVNTKNKAVVQFNLKRCPNCLLAPSQPLKPPTPLWGITRLGRRMHHGIFYFDSAPPHSLERTPGSCSSVQSENQH